MPRELENDEERRGMGTATAFLLGLGIGVVGTVLVVAANEEKFGRAVRRTKLGAAEMGKRLASRYDDAVDDVRERVVSAAEGVEHGARRVADKFKA
jgi:hypothetical protein